MGGGGAFLPSDCNDEMFNDVWNMVQKSYVMSHDMSQVTHQKAEKGRELYSRFQPTWGLGVPSV